jgi:hypothetical protein
MRRAVITAALALGLIAPASAAAYAPSAQDRKDALSFAETYWGDRGYDAADYPGCKRVITRVRHLDRGVRGYQPEGWCVILLSDREDWSAGGVRDDWWNVCATVIHEYGHLLGKRHTDNRQSIMTRYVDNMWKAAWYPWFSGCRYDDDDPDGDGYPDR